MKATDGIGLTTSDKTADSRSLLWNAAEWLFLLLAPPAAWLAFGIVLINQDNYLDPWYYLGYGRAFTVLHHQFGWPYYAVRFPVIILNGLALSGDHPLIGYAVLRYLLVLACGVPLYRWARQGFGRSAAAIGYLFLFCNPILLRVILWDLTTFVSVPLALAGLSIWLLSDRVGGRVLSGFLMMASVASQTFTGTAIATFLAAQVVRRLRSRELHGLLVHDILATALGAAACFGVGCLYYYVRIGAFDPRLLVTVTVEAVRAGNVYAASHSTPLSFWAAREYHIYVPPLCVAMSGILLGRRVFENTAVASLWWFGVVYTGVYAVYQFVFGSFVLETFYYFAHLSLVVYPLVPLIISELIVASPGRRRLAVAAAGGAALLLLPAANRLDPAAVEWLANVGYMNVALLGWMLAIAAAIVVAARVLARTAASAAVVAAFLLCVQTFSWLSPTQRQVFDRRHRARETGVYLAATQMLDVFAAVSTPATPVIVWHCPIQYSVGSIVSSVLLFSLGNPFSAEPCAARVGDYERHQLSIHRPHYVLMINEKPAVIAEQETALVHEGYRVDERLTRMIGDDAFQATMRLVEISKETP